MIRGTGIGARWEEEVFAALPDGELIFASGVDDWQGHETIFAKLDDGRWAFYEWSYGSCAGCDGWEGEEHTIAPEVQRDAAIMDRETAGDFLIGCMSKDARWLAHEDKMLGPSPQELLAKILGAKQ